MHVDDYDQAVVEDHLHGRIQIAEILRRKHLRPVHRKHGLGIHAQAHVVEAHGLDEGDVFYGGPALEMFASVAALVIHLSEPLAEVDAAPQVLGAGKSRGGSSSVGGLGRRVRRTHNSEIQNNYTVHFAECGHRR